MRLVIACLVDMEKKPVLRKPIYTNSEKNYNPIGKKLCLQIGSGFRIVFGYTFITLLPRGEILFLTSGAFHFLALERL